MALLFISSSDSARDWTRALHRVLPDLEVRTWPEAGDPADVDLALVWKPPQGVLKHFPNLKLIASLGMGVDHIFRDPELPDVPVVRLVDESIKTQMAEYVALECLRIHRQADAYDAFQREGRWQPLPARDMASCPVGIMGLGEIGATVARTLTRLGFPVRGWSRSPKTLAGVESFAGATGLAPFLGACRVLVCVLPLTPETENLMDAELLARLPWGAWFINIARGDHVVDEDLLAALAAGHLAGATLDVFRQEPLPVAHPFWTHPKVRITPHVAGLTVVQSAAPQVAENLRRALAGEALLNQVERERGY